VQQHHGDVNLFWCGELQSLCVTCHNGLKQEIELKGYSTQIGLDGWPENANHPANKAGGVKKQM
jgi:hypothetical protein